MDKFTKLTGIAAPMPLVNIDTDMIIPKQFLKTIQRSGLGKNLFDEMRYTQDGAEIPDFVLNQPAYRQSQIIVAGDNFGCGSSREHAVWALAEWGIRAIIAPGFGNIFYGNCVRNIFIRHQSSYWPKTFNITKLYWRVTNKYKTINIEI